MNVERKTIAPELSVSIYSHALVDLGTSCEAWSLVTSGLSRVGQDEVVFTVLRNGAVTFPDGVLNYIPALKHFATQGKIVRDGDISGYRAPGPFKFGEFVGVAFFTAPHLPGIALPERTLAGVFLRESELAMAARCSARRVLNRLGKGSRYFPTPYWSDPSRKSLYLPGDAEQSILCQFSRANISEATATLSRDTVSLRIPHTFAKDLAERIATGSAWAVLPSRKPGVTAALVWSPGQTEPEAIFADGTSPDALAATFVAFVPNAAPSDDIRFMEDGYAAVLCEPSTRNLVQALRTGMSLELGDREGRRLHVTVT